MEPWDRGGVASPASLKNNLLLYRNIFVALAVCASAGSRLNRCVDPSAARYQGVRARLRIGRECVAGPDASFLWMAWVTELGRRGRVKGGTVNRSARYRPTLALWMARQAAIPPSCALGVFPR